MAASPQLAAETAGQFWDDYEEEEEEGLREPVISGVIPVDISIC